jgi:hypothetical protein
MGLFSLFSKRKPEEIYQSLAKKIVVSALLYRQEIEAPDDKRSADAGAELIYLLLHLLDRQAFDQLGATGRDTVFDEVSQIAVADYAGAIFNANTPQDVIIDSVEQMMSTLNSRQSVYAQCDSLAGEMFPGKGTMIFALSFYVHQALGNTDRTDVEDILIGKNELRKSDMKDFPSVPEVMNTAITVGSLMIELKIPGELKHLE